MFNTSEFIRSMVAENNGMNKNQVFILKAPKGSAIPDLPSPVEGDCPTCGTHMHALLPFGFNGALLCVNCAQKPHNYPAVEARMAYYIKNNKQIMKEE